MSANSDHPSCSSDTGGVLIRSTRVLPSAEAGPAPGSLKITVQKLRGPAVHPAAEQQHRSSGTEKQQRPKPRQKPDKVPPLRAAVRTSPDGRTRNKPEPTKENSQPPAVDSSPDRKFSAGTHVQQQPGHDLLTSRFATGGRGVVLAALKQRSHSAPHRREVKVQLMDSGPFQTCSEDDPGLRTCSQEAVGTVGVQMEAGQSSRDDTNSTADLIKSQARVEAQVSHVAEDVQRLLQADRDRGWSLSQQALCHLETLHSQQLQLQSQLLDSALRMVTSHGHVTCTTSDLTSAKVTHLDAAANQPPRPPMATRCRDRRTEQTR